MCHFLGWLVLLLVLMDVQDDVKKIRRAMQARNRRDGIKEPEDE